MNRFELADQLLKVAGDATKVAAATLKDTKDPLYRTPVKVRGYNGHPTVMSAHGKDAGDVLIQLTPDLSKAKHAQKAREFKALAETLQKKYEEAQDLAAQDTWGRDFQITDYRVSGIGSDEFSEKHKDTLRTLAHGMSEAETISRAHEYASKSRRIK